MVKQPNFLVRSTRNAALQYSLKLVLIQSQKTPTFFAGGARRNTTSGVVRLGASSSDMIDMSSSDTFVRATGLVGAGGRVGGNCPACVRETFVIGAGMRARVNRPAHALGMSVIGSGAAADGSRGGRGAQALVTGLVSSCRRFAGVMWQRADIALGRTNLGVHRLRLTIFLGLK